MGFLESPKSTSACTHTRANTNLRKKLDEGLLPRSGQLTCCGASCRFGAVVPFEVGVEARSAHQPGFVSAFSVEKTSSVDFQALLIWADSVEETCDIDFSTSFGAIAPQSPSGTWYGSKLPSPAGSCSSSCFTADTIC